jgi:hypothetical protein
MTPSTIPLVALLASLAALIPSGVALAQAAPRAADFGRHSRLADDPAQAVAALTAQEVADLQYLREEEKLARDVYQAMFRRWGLQIFWNVSQAEQRHTDAVRYLIEAYGIGDPAATTRPGEFVDAHLQQLYDSLVRTGLASSSAAIAVGVLVEETDIADLQEAMARTSRAEVVQVFGNLLHGSTNHLAAFTEWSR